MKLRVVGCLAALLTVGVSHVALAADPLRLRTEGAAQTSESGGGGAWKLVAFAGLAGAVALAWRFRRGAASPQQANPVIRVVARTPLGARSALIAVEVDDQRWLLGVTPTNIVQLAELEAPAAAAPVARANDSMEARVQALLGAGRLAERPVVRAAAEPAERDEAEPVHVEAQAKKLLLLRKRPLT